MEGSVEVNNQIKTKQNGQIAYLCIIIKTIFLSTEEYAKLALDSG